MKLLIGALALLLVAGCGSKNDGGSAAKSSKQIPQVPAPNGGDWTQQVVETPEGGFRMGNPNAPVKVVEYASLGCPHCAEFEEDGVPHLTGQYVKSGQVSWEFRTYLLFPQDAGVSMLLHCEGAAPFFRLSQELYATQRDWDGKIIAAPPAQQQQIQAMPAQQKAAAFVKLAGLDDFFRQRGMPSSRIDACLTDPKGLDQLARIVERGNKDGVNSTPTFFINGKMVDMNNESSAWNQLEPPLRAGIGL
jgi:protein-disulfide isomerase